MMTIMVRTGGLAAALAVACLSAGCASSAPHGGPGRPPSSSSTLLSSQQSQSSSPAYPPIEYHLWSLAVSGARENGGTVLAAEAVQSTHGKAVQVTMGDIVDGDEPVWVIQVEGTKPFACGGCSRPAGASAPTGRYLIYVLDAQTFTQTDFGITAKGASLSRLGTVITLHG